MRLVIQLCIGVFLLAGLCLGQRSNGCLPCHSVRDLSIQASNGQIASMYIDSARYQHSIHGSLHCDQCHTNMASKPGAPAPRPVDPYVAKYRPGTRPAAGACITCHPKEWESYRGSIHAAELRKGKLDTPFCSDCHGSHYILPSQDLESRINPENVPHTCASCHAVGLLMAKYNVKTNTYQTSQQSVHGRKLLLGEKGVAVCTSCHGVHDIKSPNDPASPLYPTHRADTCRKCHKGASDNFALTFTHLTPSPTEEPLIYYIRLAYRLAIGAFIAVMGAYVLLDLLRRTIEYVRRRREMCR